MCDYVHVCVVCALLVCRVVLCSVCVVVVLLCCIIGVFVCCVAVCWYIHANLCACAWCVSCVWFVVCLCLFARATFWFRLGVLFFVW